MNIVIFFTSGGVNESGQSAKLAAVRLRYLPRLLSFERIFLLIERS